MENNPAPAESSDATSERPPKSMVPITIDVESDDDVVQQKKDQQAKEPDPAEPKMDETKKAERNVVEKEAKAPLVIPVDEDEEESAPASKEESPGEAETDSAVEKKPEEGKGSPRKKRAPEVISVDEDDEDEKPVEEKSGDVPTEKEPDSTLVDMEVDDVPSKLPKTVSLDDTVLMEETQVEGTSKSLTEEVQQEKVHVKVPEVIAVDETEDMDLVEESKRSVEEVVTKKVPEVITVDESEDKVAEENEVTKEPPPKESEVQNEQSKKPEVISLDETEDTVNIEVKQPEVDPSKSPEVASTEDAEDMDVEEKKETKTSPQEPIVEIKQPKKPEVISLDEIEEKVAKAEKSDQESSNTSEDADKRSDEKSTAEKSKDVSTRHRQPAVESEVKKDLEKKASEKEAVLVSVETSKQPNKTDDGQEADNDIILIDDAKDNSVNPDQVKDNLKASSEGADEAEIESKIEDQNKIKEDEQCEKTLMPTKENEEDKKETVLNDSIVSADKSTEKLADVESKTIENVNQDDDDVMMVDSEPNSEKDDQKTEKTADKIGNDNNEEVMMIDSDSNQMETSTDNSEVEKKASIEDANCKEVDISKDKPKEAQGDLSAKEADELVPSSTEKPSTEGENKSPETDNPSEVPRKKTYVLDEKLGIFQEKDAPPEEKVTQLITGDSDEDVVMIEDDPPKKAVSKPMEVKKPEVLKKTPIVEKQKENKPKTAAAPKSQNIDCINAECRKESKETAPAPSFVLNFFGIPKKSKKQRICVICYDEVVIQYSDLCGKIVEQQPLLFCDMPRKNELVEISDSSEEEEDEETKLETGKPVSSDIISLVESELNDILTSTFEKINLSQQIDWTEQIMKQKIAYNTKISDEINNELNELQRKVDRIHLQLYSKSRPRYQELPPCNIFHEVDLLNKNQSSANQTQSTGTGPNRQYSPQKPSQQPQQKQQQIQPVSPGAGGQQSAAAKKEEFIRPAVVVGQFYFAVKHKLLSNWSECQVVEAVNLAEKALYKVNFLYNQGAGSAPIKVVPAKYLAYRHSFNVKLPLGTRVIARFDAGTTQPTAKPSQQAKANAFYPGIIAESFGKYNRHRYLIFFDDGYAQYVGHGDVRVVCEESKDVWTDIHPHSQEFIRNYLMNYRSQRPMVQVKVGQRIITEWKGKWIYAKVVDIDASLVQLHFPDDNRFEWIYRGSTRLGPLYQEKALSMSKMSNNKFSKFQKRNEPSIEYITLDDDEEDTNKEQEPKKSTPQEQALQSYHQQNKNFQLNQVTTLNHADAASIRSVAKKSTFNRTVPTTQPSAVFMNSSTIYCEDDRPKGKIVYYTAKKHLPPLKYKPHECTPGCLFKITHNLKSYSPLAKPLLSGWERQLCKMKYKKVFVVYRAPCGRRVRNMYELHKYIRMTKATLNVENFDFDPMVHCLAEYVIENHIYHNPDLSDGKEFMAVPCVNYFDDTKPPPCIYSTERIPSEGVKLNLDTDFLCGCDCEDDCLDKTRCQCWQLTIAGAKFGNPNTSVDNIGYVYKRLQETVVTGIYECNARCKCKNNCLNRVVQHPLQTKLQVFKTSNRGWGIRCLNDVSKGSFICIYSGHLLTEETGNDICLTNENKAGDEYFADLDYIETVEQLKEGYETDVVESESDNDSDEPDYEARRDSDASDDDFTSTVNPSNAAVKTRSQIRRESTKRTEVKKPTKKKDDSKNGSDDDEREMVNLVPNSDMTKGESASPSIKYRSVRKLFGKHEQIYIMDAKKSGNLGRYFNHSCNPNLFVQNVFVDTHDLRFPWVAFFALCNIRAGSELTWNYNYDVGSVPGKVLYCQCGAENCRQRLL